MILDNNRSAKDYISESYAQELSAIQAKARLLETPASIIERENTEKTFALAEAVLSRNILSEEFTGEYSGLLEMIEAKKEELKKLYGIEADEYGLQAVKSAMQTVSGQFSQELKEQDENFRAELKQEEEVKQAEIDETSAKNDAQVKEIEKKTFDKVFTSKQEAEREKEEYDYQLSRTRKREKEERERAVAERENVLKAKEKEVADEKQLCLDKLSEIQSKQELVDLIPEQLENARAEGAAAKEKELNKEYGYHKWMSDKENQNRIDELKDELEALQQKYDALCKEKDALSVKLDKCNAESRQLTSDTVRSIGGINILNADNHTYNGQGKK